MDYKNKLKSLLIISIKKGLTIQINSKCELISIYGFDENNEFTFNYNSYYTGDLSDTNIANTLPIDELIEEVKNYNPPKNENRI